MWFRGISENLDTDLLTTQAESTAPNYIKFPRNPIGKIVNDQTSQYA